MWFQWGLVIDQYSEVPLYFLERTCALCGPHPATRATAHRRFCASWHKCRWSVAVETRLDSTRRSALYSSSARSVQQGPGLSIPRHFTGGSLNDATYASMMKKHRLIACTMQPYSVCNNTCNIRFGLVVHYMCTTSALHVTTTRVVSA